MSNFIRNKITDSAEDFLNIVWEEIQRFPIISGGELIPVETATARELTEYLDLYAGIDAWQVRHCHNAITGIASRVQWVGNKNPYNSFSIRIKSKSGKPTEFDKRLNAIQTPGFIYPYLTVQAFLDKKGGDLLSAAAIRTEELISYADYILNYFKHNDEDCGIIANNDNSQFLYISWKRLIEENILNKQDVFKTWWVS